MTCRNILCHAVLKKSAGFDCYTALQRSPKKIFTVAVCHSTDGLQIFVCFGYTYGDAKPRRWAKRALDWQTHAKNAGRRPNTWVTKFEEFARRQRWDNFVGTINA